MTGPEKGQWTAIVLAGNRPGRDPLAGHFGKKRKAMVPLGGRPMLYRVLETLNASPEIGRIVVLTRRARRTAEKLEQQQLGEGVTVIKAGAGISAGILALIDDGAADFPILVTTADHALLTPEMVAELLGSARGDLSVAMVEKANYDRRFARQARTWLKLADGAWSGANLFALATPRVVPALQMWRRVEQDRKKARALFRHFGPWLAFRALTRTIGLGDALARAGRRLGLEAHLVAMSDPVAAIDVDKLGDHALAEAILAERDEEATPMRSEGG